MPSPGMILRQVGTTSFFIFTCERTRLQEVRPLHLAGFPSSYTSQKNERLVVW